MLPACAVARAPFHTKIGISSSEQWKSVIHFHLNHTPYCHRRRMNSSTLISKRDTLNTVSSSFIAKLFNTFSLNHKTYGVEPARSRRFNRAPRIAHTPAPIGFGVTAAITSGALPAGISANIVIDQLQFFGTPTTQGSTNVVFNLTDAQGWNITLPRIFFTIQP